MEATTKTDLARIFAALAGYIRGHWAVENHLHWQLDVTINEDRSRKRVDHSAGNYSRLNRWALNPLNVINPSRPASAVNATSPAGTKTISYALSPPGVCPAVYGPIEAPPWQYNLSRASKVL